MCEEKKIYMFIKLIKKTGLPVDKVNKFKNLKAIIIR